MYRIEAYGCVTDSWFRTSVTRKDIWEAIEYATGDSTVAYRIVGPYNKVVWIDPDLPASVREAARVYNHSEVT